MLNPGIARGSALLFQDHCTHPKSIFVHNMDRIIFRLRNQAKGTDTPYPSTHGLSAAAYSDQLELSEYADAMISADLECYFDENGY